MKIFLRSLAFAAVFFFCWNTNIVNRTEADDAFDYAWQAEQSGSAGLYHPHHLLYGSMAKWIYSSAKQAGYEGRAYPLLRAVSALSAAGILFLFFRFCRDRFGMSKSSAVLGSGLLLFSYGFWRYANEAEVIHISGFFALWALSRVSSPGQKSSQAFVAGTLCGFSVLMHIMNIIPVALAAPVFYLSGKNRKGLIIFWLAASAVIAAGYVPVFFSHPGLFLNGGGLHPSLVRGVLFGWSGFFQSVVGVNFMLGYGMVRDALVNLFPSRMLMEEICLGQHLPGWLVISASVSMILVIFGLLVPVGCAVRNLWRSGLSGFSRGAAAGIANEKSAPVAVTVWFIGYAVTVCLLEPENPEVWIMGLTPFWLMFCGWIVARCSGRKTLWLIGLPVGLLCLHNYAGGILPLQNPAADYNRQKAEWIVRQAVPGDIVLTAGSPVFERYLRYYCRAQVEYPYEWSAEQFQENGFMSGIRAVAHSSGTVYLFADIFDPPHSLALRFPVAIENILRVSERLRPVVTQVHQDEFGGIYAFQPDHRPGVPSLPAQRDR